MKQVFPRGSEEPIPSSDAGDRTGWMKAATQALTAPTWRSLVMQKELPWWDGGVKAWRGDSNENHLQVKNSSKKTGPLDFRFCFFPLGELLMLI